MRSPQTAQSSTNASLSIFCSGPLAASANPGFSRVSPLLGHGRTSVETLYNRISSSAAVLNSGGSLTEFGTLAEDEEKRRDEVGGSGHDSLMKRLSCDVSVLMLLLVLGCDTLSRSPRKVDRRTEPTPELGATGIMWRKSFRIRIWLHLLFFRNRSVTSTVRCAH